MPASKAARVIVSGLSCARNIGMFGSLTSTRGRILNPYVFTRLYVHMSYRCLFTGSNKCVL